MVGRWVLKASEIYVTIPHVLYPIAAMEAALHAVAALNEQVGVPWLAARSPAVVYPAAGDDTRPPPAGGALPYPPRMPLPDTDSSQD